MQNYLGVEHENKILERKQKRPFFRRFRKNPLEFEEYLLPVKNTADKC